MAQASYLVADKKEKVSPKSFPDSLHPPARSYLLRFLSPAQNALPTRLQLRSLKGTAPIKEAISRIHHYIFEVFLCLSWPPIYFLVLNNIPLLRCYFIYTFT